MYDYRDSLEFKYEYQLTAEPLRIDLVIIKKLKEQVIDKNIARIFRSCNLLEYKSPTDFLSVNDFLKVCAYASLYAVINPGVDFADITLTFIGRRHPRTLLRYLTKTRGYRAEETSPGIYRISGDYLPIQIIESKKLSDEDNLWLNSLTNNLKKSSLEHIMNESKKRGTEDQLRAFFDTLSRANPYVFKEVHMSTRTGQTFEEVFTEAGIIPKWIEQGRVQGLEQGRVQGIEQGRVQGIEKVAWNLIKTGMPPEEIAQATELPVEKVRALASTSFDA